jgi:hypothetical protein
MNETEQQPHGLCSTERITRSRSSRRCRRSQSFSAHVEVGDENENELEEDYVEKDDEDDNDHNSSRRTKAGKYTMQYTKEQNERWNEKFQRLVTYKKEYNSTSVPAKYKEDPKLGIWVSDQRKKYNHSTLSETRVERLESIGFSLDPLGEQWTAMYDKLVAYKKHHNSTVVPRGYVQDPKLGVWVREQRINYNRGIISETRVGHLDSIGFAWDPLGEKWTESFHKLVAYKKQHKSTNVSLTYETDHKLVNWVHNQRMFYKNKNHSMVNRQGAKYYMHDLSTERINQLESIGFVWDPLDAQWMEMYQKLVAYKKQHRST